MKAIASIAAAMAVLLAAGLVVAQTPDDTRRQLEKLGFERNVDLDKGAAASTPAVGAVDISRYQVLDNDGDGSIFRREYFTGRAGRARVARFGTARQRHYQRRLESRFRSADRNRDGRISPGELRTLPDPRF